MAADNKSGEKSRKEQRKEARLVKNKKKFDSWVQHQKSRHLKKSSRNSQPKNVTKSHNNVHISKQQEIVPVDASDDSDDSDGNLRGENDGVDMLLEGIPSTLASFEGEEVTNFEEAESSKTSFDNDISHKRHKQRQSVKEELHGEMENACLNGVSVDASCVRNDDRKKPTLSKISKIKLTSVKDPDSTRLKISNRKKTKFEEFLEMNMKAGIVAAEEDLALERKLAKKLKVKEGKLRGDDDDLSKLFEGIPSVLGSLEEETIQGIEEAPTKTLEDKASRKKRKRTKSSEEEKDIKMVDHDVVGESEPLKSSDTEVGLKKLPSRAPELSEKLKYMAPHLRSHVGNESEDYSQARRQIRGLLNRLSESNVESLTGEISTIFHSVGRSVGSQIISEEVLASCSNGPRGNEQYAAVFAAFVSGMACLVGIDFGAKLLAALAKCFEDEYLEEDNLSLRNLTLLLSYLYIFGVCSSDLIYDFLIMLSKRLMEVDVSTILTILQCCGMKLRGDDPVAMKNFVLSVQDRVNQLKSNSSDGVANTFSKRMEFMLETICDIKNNKKRPKEDTVQLTRIKKWLQKLRVENVLIRGLKWRKLLDPTKKGQWWLSGDMASSVDNIEEVGGKIDMEVLEAQKLLQLAAGQRMNTDTRRTIFCIIMSGEDYIDAFEKLLRLDLPGSQDREIMRILVECCLQEKIFNKYYCVLASKLCCHDKNHKFTLQYCLWDHFKELEPMQMIRSLHLAKFVAEMLTSFSLSLAVLKVVDLSDISQLTPKKIMHFRMLFEAVFDNSDKLVWNMFTRIAVVPEYETLRNGIVFFVGKYVLSNQTSLVNKFKVAKKALNNVEGVIL